MLRTVIEKYHSVIIIVKERILAKCRAQEANGEEVLQMLEQAKQEWISAKDYFENVSEPELIDYAVYSMEATEKRYNYLLKKVRKMELEQI